MYDAIKSTADRVAIDAIRRQTTELEFTLMPMRGDFEFQPDALAVKQHVMIVMLAATSILERVEGTDFAPVLIVPADTLRAL